MSDFFIPHSAITIRKFARLRPPSGALSAFSSPLAAELARLTEALLKTTDDSLERMRLVLKALHELGQLRRHNHRAARLVWDKLLWQRAEEKLDKDAERSANHQALQKMKNRLLDPIWTQLEVNDWAKIFGGGEAVRKVAEFIVEVQRELPPGSLSGKKPSDSVKPSPTKSGPIQPNPTNSSNGHAPVASPHAQVHQSPKPLNHAAQILRSAGGGSSTDCAAVIVVPQQNSVFS